MDKVYRLKMFNMNYKKIDGKWHAWDSIDGVWFLSSMYDSQDGHRELPYGTISDYDIITEDEMDKE